MVFVVGEILFDLFGDEKRLGGAPFNYAYHLKQLGVPVRLVTRVGDDQLGRDILDRLAADGFNLDDVQIDAVHPTGTVRVGLEHADSPDFEITADVAYDYVQFLPEVHVPIIRDARMMYFGTLVQRSARGFQNVQDMLHQMPVTARGFYDVNLRPDSYREAAVKSSLAHTHVLKISDSEWDAVKAMLQFDGDDDAFGDHLFNAFPIDTIALTKGADGSRLITPEGRRSAEPARVEPFVDAVGAGDAYAAMLTLGLLSGWPAGRILAQASHFAGRICQIQGAIPDAASFYDPYRNLQTNGGNNAG